MKKIYIGLIISIFLFSGVFAGVISYNKINLVSNYEDLDGPVWEIAWLLDDYTTDYMQGFIKPADCKEETGSSCNQSLEIRVTGNSNKCQYDMSARPDLFPIKTVTAIEREVWSWDYAELKQWARDTCMKVPNSGYAEDIPLALLVSPHPVLLPLKAHVWCLKEEKELGKIAEVTNLKYVTENTWQVMVSGKPTEQKVLSNSDTGDGVASKLGENTWVLFQGQLSSGDTCPVGAKEYGAYSTSFTNNWRIIDESQYQTYKDFVSSGLEQEIVYWSLGSQRKEDLENKFNTKANNAIKEKPLGTYQIHITDQSYNNGKMYIGLDKLYRFPLFRLFVDADYLELVIPTGKPQIVSASNVKFAEGDLSKAYTEVTVKNSGTAKGGFYARVVDCDSGFGGGDGKGLTLNAGETSTFKLAVTGLQGKGSCSVEFKEVITTEAVKKVFNIEVTKPDNCPVGNQYCVVGKDNRHVIMECKDGQEYTVFKTCESNEVCSYDDNAKPYCKVIGSCAGEGEKPTKDKPCCSKDGLISSDDPIPVCIKKPFQYWDMLFGGLSALLAFPLSFWFFKRLFGEKDKGLALMTAIVVAVLVGVIIYLVIHWWLGLSWWSKLLLKIGTFGGIGIYVVVAVLGVSFTIFGVGVGFGGKKK